MQSIRKILLCASLLCAASLPAVAKDCHVFADVGVSPSRSVGSPDGFFARTGERDLGLGFGGGCTFAHGLGFEMAHVQLSEMRSEFGTVNNPPIHVGSDRVDSSAIFATYRFTSAEDRWTAGAKIGLHRWSFDTVLASETSPRTFPLSYNDTDTAFGFDLGYALSKRWSVGVDWSEYAMQHTSEDRVAMRVEYHFR